jgi:hypothetical protein
MVCPAYFDFSKFGIATPWQNEEREGSGYYLDVSDLFKLQQSGCPLSRPFFYNYKHDTFAYNTTTGIGTFWKPMLAEFRKNTPQSKAALDDMISMFPSNRGRWVMLGNEPRYIYGISASQYMDALQYLAINAWNNGATGANWIGPNITLNLAGWQDWMDDLESQWVSKIKNHAQIGQNWQNMKPTALGFHFHADYWSQFDTLLDNLKTWLASSTYWSDCDIWITEFCALSSTDESRHKYSIRKVYEFLRDEPKITQVFYFSSSSMSASGCTPGNYSAWSPKGDLSNCDASARTDTGDYFKEHQLSWWNHLWNLYNP